ncbi:hypothetical protein NLX83_15945 [Allokutzneria sp. A3M-2-11 16]|uniref:hypothetical protein n=1 Tax=Allokutzneria sp. A3M-2-11 16 TaxID=2962043 RepID=UPI0020B7DAF8|nr:hypothetical protein [Allokutzneria sp. A3M-2-11 16]MCP3800758.1 hypothetical protein [Allokutzneria sp. A3M-2-11 16]
MRFLGGVLVACALVLAVPGSAVAAAEPGPDCGLVVVLGLSPADCQAASPSIPTAKTAEPTSAALEPYLAGEDEVSGGASLAAPPVSSTRGEPAPALAIGLALLALAGVGAVAVRIVRD